MTDICLKPLHEQSALLDRGEISSVELTDLYLDRIARLDGDMGSYLTVCDDTARAHAADADGRIAAGKRRGALDGIPIALKDIFITKGIATTCASNMLSGYIPPYDGHHAARLNEQGAVLLGKLNMDEFAMGSSNEYSAFKPVRNPWNRDCTPGGSSGGSAAAVAAGLCAASLGTDTGGSIRQPAAMCGLVGLKPTYGRVSRYGMIAFASSLDQAGPLVRDVTDCAMMLKAIAGHDPRDATSLTTPVPDYTAALTSDIAGCVIGVPKEYFVDGMDSEVEASVRAAAAQFERLGATVRDISLPHTDYAVPAYYIIAPAEASANLARYDGVRFGHHAVAPSDITELYQRSRTEGFGPEVTLRIIIGTYVLSAGYYDAYYLKAQKVRTLIKADFMRAFGDCDAILTPTSPIPPFKLGERLDDPIKMYLADVFTIPVNLAGLPALSMPCGFTASGLPIGVQLIGSELGEATILKLAFAYECATPWHTRRPPA